jgi:hypothetical protein
MRKILFVAVMISFVGCTKETEQAPGDKQVIEAAQPVASRKPQPPQPQPTSYTTYSIRQGQHYCDQNTLRSVTTSEMKFMAKFDNSAVYTAVTPENQYDIHKLWGFSEGFNNQYNSARVGWAWNDGALRLYGYAYANGVRYSQEITAATIGTDITCSIKLVGNTYLFTVNGTSINLPRGSSSTQASGYQQYPYFGGDEVAPHLITILIKSI